jgi:aryl-alcohol dehydrogenase-like predicted oxidoreductase
MYFKDKLHETVDRVERLQPVIPAGMDLPELGLRFILSHPAVSTVIPGMRKARHVERNLAAGDGRGLERPVVAALRPHRWDRVSTVP